jgi:hypothetical protein
MIRHEEIIGLKWDDMFAQWKKGNDASPSAGDLARTAYEIYNLGEQYEVDEIDVDNLAHLIYVLQIDSMSLRRIARIAVHHLNEGY